MKTMTKDAQSRISQARDGLTGRGFRCLSAGKFGLPSYTHVEAWTDGANTVYLLIDAKSGGWDLLAQVCRENNVIATWEALDALMAGAKE